MGVSQPLSQPLEPQRQSVAKLLRMSALLAACYVGGVHLAFADERYTQDARWIGIVFAAGGLVLIITAGVAASGDRWGRPLVGLAWLASGGCCATFFVLFVVSRTSGLPGYHHNDWPGTQVLALILEVAYVVATAAALTQTVRAPDEP